MGLNAAKTFTGGTSVNGGTLNLNGSNMTDSIAVSAGALLGVPALRLRPWRR